MKKSPYISNAVIRRLPRYYRYLVELEEEGLAFISSQELSKRMGLTASQLRQDLNHFGDFGQQGVGYPVSELKQEVAKIIGLDREHKLIIMGAGHLGTALARNASIAKRGFKVEALFDVNESLIGNSISGHPILPLSELENYLKDHPADIAVLALPRAAAHETAERLVKAGITAFWNFTSVDLATEEQVIVENVHLTDSLMTLSYRIHNKD